MTVVSDYHFQALNKKKSFLEKTLKHHKSDSCFKITLRIVSSCVTAPVITNFSSETIRDKDADEPS